MTKGVGMKRTEEMSVLEAGRALGMRDNTVRALIQMNRLEARKVAGRWRVSTAAVKARLQERVR